MSSVTWQDLLWFEVFISPYGAFHPTSTFRDALTADRSKPLNQMRHLKEWIKDNLPKEPKYSKLDPNDDQITQSLFDALVHRTSKSIDKILLHREIGAQVLTTFESMSQSEFYKDVPKESQDQLNKAKAMIENKVLASATRVDSDDFEIVETPQNILQREIELLKKWKDNPTLFLTSEIATNLLK